MSDIDLNEIEAGLKALSGVDWVSALKAFRSADLAGEITAAEDVASIIAVFLPEAVYARDALVVLGFLVEAQRDGLIRPAVPEDEAMARVEREHGGR
jgi:hypothetical protein